MLKRNTISVPLCCLIFLSACRGRAQSGVETMYKQNPEYTIQTELYSIYKTEKADIVMLGNSITFGVNWNELMGRTTVINRGIASDNMYGYLQRLENIYTLHPKLCCIMGGINDIYQGLPVEVVFENYKKLIEGLRSHKIVPVIQSTLFISSKWRQYTEKNLEVAKLDILLADYARRNDVDYVNLNAVMSKDNLLKEELTTDGVHLTAKGYAIWRDELEKILRKYGL